MPIIMAFAPTNEAEERVMEEFYERMTCAFFFKDEPRQTRVGESDGKARNTKYGREWKGAGRMFAH